MSDANDKSNPFGYITDQLEQSIEDSTLVQVKGKVLQVIGTIIKASVPGVKIGELCILKNPWEDVELMAEVVGFSKGWLHHEGRNPHHWEYWIDKDYSNLTFKVITMPANYLIESILDRMAASKNYNPNYDQRAPLEFFDKGRDRIFMGEENARRIRYLLNYLAENGEEKALIYYSELYRKYKKDNTFDVLSDIKI